MRRSSAPGVGAAQTHFNAPGVRMGTHRTHPALASSASRAPRAWHASYKASAPGHRVPPHLLPLAASDVTCSSRELKRPPPPAPGHLSTAVTVTSSASSMQSEPAGTACRPTLCTSSSNAWSTATLPLALVSTNRQPCARANATPCSVPTSRCSSCGARQRGWSRLFQIRAARDTASGVGHTSAM